MNKIKITLFILAIITNAFIACGQSERVNQKKEVQKINKESIRLNDSASVMQTKITGGQIPIDSMKAVEKLYKQSIKIDANYRIAYLNLWNVYNTIQNYDENIRLCTTWLRHNPKDIDFLLKRGVLYEHQKDSVLSNLDYEMVEKYVNEWPNPKIEKTMTDQDIALLIHRSYIEWVVKKNNYNSVKVLSKLLAQLPDNKSVKNAYNVLNSSNRSQYLNSLIGVMN